MKSLRKAKDCLTGLNSKHCVILGSQWGDEGKGKLVDILSAKYDYCARFNGGANAGHTVVANGLKFAFHLLPCGILYDNCVNILGHGCVINLASMFDELKQLDKHNINYKGRLLISDRAHLVTEMQLQADARNETDPKKRMIGTTKKGIGPTYASKANRIGVRAGDLRNWEMFETKYKLLRNRYLETENISHDYQRELREFKELRERMLSENMIQDTVVLVNQIVNDPTKRLLSEAANAAMLDLDYGTYPYVTSSSTTIGGICTGLGIPPKQAGTVIGIMKAYTTRVGEGPFPTELKDEIGASMQKVGHEFGATTGRPRRCGWIDLQVIKYGNMINQYTSLNLTKLDVLTGLKEIKIGTGYRINGKSINYMPSTIEELAQVEVEYETVKGWESDISRITDFKMLPKEAQSYITRLEEILGIPISWIGTGPERESMVLKDKKPRSVKK